MSAGDSSWNFQTSLPEIRLPVSQQQWSSQSIEHAEHIPQSTTTATLSDGNGQDLHYVNTSGGTNLLHQYQPLSTPELVYPESLDDMDIDKNIDRVQDDNGESASEDSDTDSESSITARMGTSEQPVH